MKTNEAKIVLVLNKYGAQNTFQVCDRLQVSYSTGYLTLRMLESRGWVTRVKMPSGRYAYTLRDTSQVSAAIRHLGENPHEQS